MLQPCYNPTLNVLTRSSLIPVILLAFVLLFYLGLAHDQPGAMLSSPHSTIDQHVPAPHLQATLELTPVVHIPLVLNAYQFDPWTRLTFDPSNETQPSLSPDGQALVFVSERAGRPDVFRLAIAAGQTTNLTQTPAADEDTPVFSPDGSTIAFASNRTGDWDIYLMSADGSVVQPAVSYTGTDELHPAFTPNGAALIFSSNRAGGNWDIYVATIGSSVWTRLTTDPAVDRFPTLSSDGATIAFRSERDGNSEVYLMDADGSNPRRVTTNPAFDGHPAIAPDGSGIVFISDRSGNFDVYGANPSGEGLIAYRQATGWQTDTPRISKDGRALLYAARPATGTFDIYLRPYASPLFTVAERGALDRHGHCGWEAGVLAYGWAGAWRATQRDEYLQWTYDWIDGCIPLKTSITHVNDGLLGYAAVVAYQAYGKPEHLAFAQQVADYLMNTATRTADGTLTHEGDTVWDDTLVSVVPFLVELSQVTGVPTYLEEAIAQVVRHASYLQDPVSGLYYHAWDESESAPLSSVYWGRGNGWVLLADVEALAAMPITHPLRSTVLSAMQKQAAALRTLQDASGLWHTVVTRSDFYVESSATALIGYALKRGVRQGWLDTGAYLPVVRAAQIGVWRKVQIDGTVTYVSAPTGPMLNDVDYNAIPYASMQLYGQGVGLLLESPDLP